MRLLLAALLVLAAVHVAPSATASPSTDELAAAALTEADLGPGYSTIQTGQVTTLDVPMHMQTFMRAPSLRNPGIEVVVDMLADISTAGPLNAEQLAEGFVRGFEFGSQGALTPARVEAPAIGQAAVMYTVTGSVAGQQMTGDIVVWQHGGVLAAVFALGTGSPTSVGYARKQEAKLTAMFGE